ncbi:MAG: cation:proton antiporter [Thiogranum sp.]|nr:cation:proton antiporter [Thiogranum sp.]
MTEGFGAPVLVLLVGVLVVVSMILHAGLERYRLPPLVGFLMLGFGLRIAEGHWGMPAPELGQILQFLGKIGIITLLFRIGLESRPAELLQRLPQASVVALLGIVLSGGLGFIAVYYLLAQSLVAALVLAAALTASSVGISVGVWQSAGAMQSPNGELLLDVAEIDDLAAILLMALLFSILPLLQGDGENSLLPALGQSLGEALVKLAAFAGLCLLFAFYVEKPLSGLARRFEPPQAYMLSIAGIGIILASLAGLLGFSFAIGAFFAGLAFSRDPEAVKQEGSFLPLYDFFSPFFFIAIGYRVDPASLAAAGDAALVLFTVAVVGKVLAGLPVWHFRDFPAAAVLGLSLVPRAEIALVIMTHALQIAGVISREMFSAMVLVSAATCLLAPVGVQFLFRKWPHVKDPG